MGPATETTMIRSQILSACSLKLHRLLFKHQVLLMKLLVVILAGHMKCTVRKKEGSQK